MEPDLYLMLFSAKWSVPQAAQAMGLPPCPESWELVKEGFREWCKIHPAVYDEAETLH
jgi:hypothetical protein